MILVAISDIHGNWPALEAVIRAENHVDGIICLGDLVNYGPHPVKCVEWAERSILPGWGIQGNHDRALGCNEDPRCSAPYRKMAAEMQAYAATVLSPEAKSYLAGLPTSTTQELDGARAVFCHAVPSDPLYAYIPMEDERRWADEAVLAGRPDFLFVGHTHRPFVRRFGDTTVVNPGSVGQPKDGDPRAAYALWRDGEVQLRRVAYDVQSVVRDLRPCAPEAIARQLGRILTAGGDA